MEVTCTFVMCIMYSRYVMWVSHNYCYIRNLCCCRQLVRKYSLVQLKQITPQQLFMRRVCYSYIATCVEAIDFNLYVSITNIYFSLSR